MAAPRPRATAPPRTELKGYSGIGARSSRIRDWIVIYPAIRSRDGDPPPVIEQRNGRARGATIFRLAIDLDLQDRIRAGESPLDQPPPDAGQRHLRSPRPAGIGLTRGGPRIDVDEPAGGGPLREGTEEIRLAVLAGADAQGEVEGKVLVRSLGWGNETAPPALQAKRHSRRRSDDGDAKSELPVFFAHRLPRQLRRQ